MTTGSVGLNEPLAGGLRRRPGYFFGVLSRSGPLIPLGVSDLRKPVAQLTPTIGSRRAPGAESGTAGVPGATGLTRA